MLDATHDPSLRSWVASANDPDSDFPVQNLPFGAFSRKGCVHLGVAIGDRILDLHDALASGAFPGAAFRQLSGDSLNEFMELGSAAWSEVRQALSDALKEDSALQSRLAPCLVPQQGADMRLPVRVGDYTDFYSSIHHATAVGRLLRPDNPLLPNYKWLPIAYHGRASSIVVSGTPVVRPSGQIFPQGAASPYFSATRRLDYELELAAYVGMGNELGSPVPIAAAEERIFGIGLLNDWSARDIQGWEYQPLGPFLGKNFATTVSPWIVTMQALQPYRVPWLRDPDDPPAMPYLDCDPVRRQGALDIRLEVHLRSTKMAAAGLEPFRLSASNYCDAYWCLAQLVTHHTVNGCNLRPGDILATGTQSGPAPEEAGSLLELSHGGRRAIVLPDGEERRFLEDGDEVILTARCELAGAARIGFGSCTGIIRAAH